MPKGEWGAVTFRDLCAKEVVQMQEGVCLGKADDLTFDAATAQIESVQLFGRPKLFGLLGREETLTITWQEIEKIGADAILVRTQLPPAEEPKQSFLQKLGGLFK